MSLKSKSRTMSNEKFVDDGLGNEDIFRKIISPKYPEDPFEVLGERDFCAPRVVSETEVGSPVQEFYRNSTVFLTGGTGFVGLLLTEKLLRCCPHVKRIYTLVRAKRNKSSRERYDEYFKNDVFKRLKYEAPHCCEKLSMIEGSLEQDNLGLSNEDRQKLMDEVDIIFHCAATVRFTEPLIKALRINVLGTKHIVKLAKEAKNLKVFVYVSTAYSFCTRLEIEEKVYPLDFNYNELIKLTDANNESELQKEEVKLLKKWPNTYVLSKAIAENYMQSQSDGLPFAIFRPSNILATSEQPVRGWINNVYGPIGLLLGFGTGVLHVVHGNMNNQMPDCLPADYTINTLLCAARETAVNFKMTIANENKLIPVYASVNNNENMVTFNELNELSKRMITKLWPFTDTVWYPSNISVESRLLYKFLSFFLHRIPGWIIDLLLLCSGREPILTKTYNKIDAAEDVLEYYRRRKWIFHANRTKQLWKSLTPQDKEIFPFDIRQVSWERYCSSAVLGARLYLLGDEIETLPAARKKIKRLYYLHVIVKTIFYVILLFLLFLAIRFAYHYFNININFT